MSISSFLVTVANLLSGEGRSYRKIDTPDFDRPRTDRTLVGLEQVCSRCETEFVVEDHSHHRVEGDIDGGQMAFTIYCEYCSEKLENRIGTQ